MSSFETISGKIKSSEEIDSLLSVWRFQSQKLVFTNGCFDIIHRGHVDYLSKAAALGNRLIVGLNTDASVSRLKGPNRPIQDENSRALIMAAFSFVDLVIFFDEETPYELIQMVQPDILVKGSDYSIDNIVGADIVLAKGGSVETLDFIPGYSTSKIIERIKL